MTRTIMAKGKDLPPTTLDELRRNLERLRLFAMLENLDEAVEQASSLEQGYVTFLAGLVQKQVLAHTDAGAQRRIRNAGFPKMKTFDSFDWQFQKGLNVQLVKDLMNLHFVKQGRPVLLLGRPGTGKSHLSTAYGVLAATAGYSVRFMAVSRLLRDLYATLADGSTDRLIARLARPDLLILDDLRSIPTKPEYANLFYDLVEARHGRRSTIVSSNLSVKLWGKVLGNVALTASLVDRLMDRAHVINIKNGRSWRWEGPEAPPEDERPSDLTPESDET
jgi:DNA replication protein DnaC